MFDNLTSDYLSRIKKLYCVESTAWRFEWRSYNQSSMLNTTLISISINRPT